MSKIVTIPAEERADVGKGASRRLRHANKIPAVVYGAGRDPRSLTLAHDKIFHMAEEEVFYSSILELRVEDGRKQKVILRDMQRHPVKPRIMHIDFQRIKDDEELRITVPLHFINEDQSPAGKASGVVVSYQLNDVEISALPENLPENIEIDLGELEIGQGIMLSEIKFPDGVKPTAFIGNEIEDVDTVVASAAYVAAQVEPEEDDEIVAPDEVEASEQKSED